MPERKENKGLKEALRRIEEARQTGALQLDLSDLGLTAVPDSIRQLSQLQELDLTRNAITTIPDFIGQLSQLQVLDLGENQIKAVPNSIAHLSQLRHLSLWNNKISAIPDSLTQLSQLRQDGWPAFPLSLPGCGCPTLCVAKGGFKGAPG